MKSFAKNISLFCQNVGEGGLKPTPTATPCLLALHRQRNLYWFILIDCFNNLLPFIFYAIKVFFFSRKLFPKLIFYFFVELDMSSLIRFRQSIIYILKYIAAASVFVNVSRKVNISIAAHNINISSPNLKIELSSSPGSFLLSLSRSMSRFFFKTSWLRVASTRCVNVDTPGGRWLLRCKFSFSVM